MKDVTLKLFEVHKRFGSGERTVRVLNGITLELRGGQSLAVMGPSGSGKSTLLHLIGTLDQPTSGTIEINGKNPFSLAEPDLAQFRNQGIGFVFQDHHLLPQYTVLENVMLPALAFKRNILIRITRPFAFKKSWIGTSRGLISCTIIWRRKSANRCCTRFDESNLHHFM